MTRLRRIGFRLAAVVVGLAPFVVLETGLALAGGGERDRDPLAGFDATDPLFVEDGDRWTVAAHRLRHFAPDGFPRERSADEFRVFVLGGSTVQGRPWSIPTSFATLAECALDAVLPQRDWRFVNCGGISYASYRLTAIAAEVLDHDPDLLILCTGHNEFLEDIEYGLIRDLPTPVAAAWAWIARTRTAQWLLGLVAPRDRPTPGEIATRLDAPDGLERFTWDPARHAAVLARFRRSATRIADACRARGVPLLIVDPPANLRDCPPFKSRPPQPTPAIGPHAEPLAELQRAAQARATAPHHAATVFAHARALDRVGRHAEARDAYIAAKDLDLCPLRILEPMRATLRDLAADRNLRWVDGHAVLESACRDQIAGAERLADHVHPTIRGHRELAFAILPDIAAAAGATLPPAWAARGAAACDARIGALPPVYFAKGRAVLEQLDRWASGRVGAPYRDD